jgi:thymidylate synthase
MSKNIEHQYLKLLKDILDNGVKKQDRTGTGTLSVFGRQIRHDMSLGFPLLTTKKMYWKGIVGELLWFLRGSTDIRDLWKNDIKIWDGDWYKKYEKSCSSPYTLEEIKQKVIKGAHAFHDSMFDLGPIYGKQWREWRQKVNIPTTLSLDESGERLYVEGTKYIDQIANLINDLKTNPDSRRLMVNSWNVGELDQMTLPPCHYGFQVYTRELSDEERVKLYEQKTNVDTSFFPVLRETLDFHNIPTRAISLMWNQRSVDTGLGLGFNIASYALLLEIIAKEVNMVPEELVGNLGDVHIYSNQIDGVKEQLTREPYPLPKLMIDQFDETNHYIGDMDDISEYNIEQFKLENYQSHPSIKLPLSN